MADFLPLPDRRYSVIYADPPWAYGQGGKGKSSHGIARQHYDTMTTVDICAMPIRSICAEDGAACFMWATFPNIAEAIKVMEAWGFRYKTAAFVWVKKNAKSGGNYMGLGAYTRANAEVCLLGVTPGFKAGARVRSHSVRQVIEAPFQGHSKKPDETRRRIVELLGDVPRIELFARQRADGWDAWGNEAPEEQEVNVEQIARDPRADFLAVYSNTIKRDGAAAMIYWLDCKTDFFTAPASRKNHLAQPGGLAVHSLNVWRRLREITVRDMTDRNAPGVRHLSEAEEETVAILGLLHDVCKVGVYHQTDPFKAAMEGKLDTMAPYEFRDTFPLGHGEKSLFLITRHMALTEEEALAIRWHMGAYDDAVKGGSRSMTEAMNLTPWVWRLQEADMCAAWIDERSAAE